MIIRKAHYENYKYTVQINMGKVKALKLLTKHLRAVSANLNNTVKVSNLTSETISGLGRN